MWITREAKVLAQAGIALIEVLVALLVLGIGVLGAAGLAWRASQSAAEASLLGQAVLLANHIGETILDDPAPQWQQLDLDAEGAAPPAAVHLQAQLRAQFPGGRLRLCRDHQAWDGRALRWSCSGSGPLVVKLGWRERGSGRLDIPMLAMPLAGGQP